MAKRDEHVAEGTFTPAGIDRVRQRALKSFDGCEDFAAPQRQSLQLACKDELPRLDDLPGITLTSFYVDGYFSVAGQGLEVLTPILESGQLALPQLTLSVGCRVAGMGEVGIESDEGKIHFDANVSDLLRGHDVNGRESLLKRIVRAGRLPASVKRGKGWAGEQVDVECPDRNRSGVWYYDREGVLGFMCQLRRTSFESGLRRVGAVLKELAASPQEYCWRAREYGSRKTDICGATYEKLRGLKFPAQRHGLQVCFRLTALDGLESLRRLAALHGRKQFQTTLCRIPLPADPTTGRHRLAKVIVRTARDGHALSLFLPAPHAALLPALGRKLGLRFSG